MVNIKKKLKFILYMNLDNLYIMTLNIEIYNINLILFNHIFLIIIMKIFGIIIIYKYR